MSTAWKLLKGLVPAGARRYLRARQRDLIFWRALRRFRRNPAAATQPGSRILPDLIYGWGNEEWSALDEYLVACVKDALASDGPILECGSGLTTLLVGVVLQQRNGTLWSLEHTPVWADRVERYLGRFRIGSVMLCRVRLKDFGDFTWYDPPMAALSESFSLVICDGPPADTPGGRYGLGPVMREKLKRGCVILLDDAEREQEQAIARRWQQELGASCATLGTAKPYARLVVGQAPETVS
jgi:hypothetical protein